MCYSHTSAILNFHSEVFHYTLQIQDAINSYLKVFAFLDHPNREEKCQMLRVIVGGTWVDQTVKITAFWPFDAKAAH